MSTSYASDFPAYDDCVFYGPWKWGDVSSSVVPRGHVLYDTTFKRPMHGYYRLAIRLSNLSLTPVYEIEYLDWWSDRGRTFSWCWGYLEAEGVWAWDWNHGLEQAIEHATRVDFDDLKMAFQFGADVHRAIDIAVLQGRAEAVKNVINSPDAPRLRILRLWTWRELVEKDLVFSDTFGHRAVTLGDMSIPGSVLAYRRNRLRRPRVLEAALQAGLNFSSMSGYADQHGSGDRMNLLDVAVLSGEVGVTQLLRDRGMVSDLAGCRFVAQKHFGELAMDESQIEAAVEAGINLNELSIILDDMFRVYVDQPCPRCDRGGAAFGCALEGEPSTLQISLLEVAIMVGDSRVARELVALGGEANFRLHIGHILDHTEVYRCRRSSCKAECRVKLFAQPSARITAATDTIRESLRLEFSRAREKYALYVNRILKNRFPIVARVLVFLVDVPPIAVMLYFSMNDRGLLPREIVSLFGANFGGDEVDD